MNAALLVVVLSPFAIVAVGIAAHIRGTARTRLHSEERRFQRLLRSDDPSALWTQPVDRKGRMQ